MALPLTVAEAVVDGYDAGSIPDMQRLVNEIDA